MINGFELGVSDKRYPAARRFVKWFAALFAVVFASSAIGEKAGADTPAVFSGLRDLSESPLGGAVSVALVTDAYRGGWFVWQAGDRSTDIAADPAGCNWVAPLAAPDGAAGAWSRQGGKGVVDVTHCGATGNDGTEDHTAISSAMAYAAHTGGLSVYVPAGTYILGASLQLDRSFSGMQLRCQNAENTILKRRDASPKPFHLLTDDGMEAINGISIEGCTFDGNRRGQDDPEGHAAVIQLNSRTSESSDFRFVNSRIVNFSRGGQGIHVKGYDRVTIDGSAFSDGGAGLFHPIYLRRVSDVRITENRIWDIGSHAIKVQTTETGATAIVSGNIIKDVGRCVLMQDSHSFIVASNTCMNARTYGISATLSVESTMRDGVISGNIVHGAEIGIYVHGSRRVNITGNVVREPREAGVKLRMSDVSTVQGNVVTAPSETGTENFACITVDDGPGDVEAISISGNLCYAGAGRGTAEVTGVRVREPGSGSGKVTITGNSTFGASNDILRD